MARMISKSRTARDGIPLRQVAEACSYILGQPVDPQGIQRDGRPPKVHFLARGERVVARMTLTHLDRGGIFRTRVPLAVAQSALRQAVGHGRPDPVRMAAAQDKHDREAVMAEALSALRERQRRLDDAKDILRGRL